jgi:hypothetical protein
MTADWLPPSRELPPPPTPATKPPALPRDPEAPGIATRPVDAICCPKCFGLGALKRDMRKDSARITWECRDCGHRWPLPATLGRERAAIA